jgi:hypothetical protein
VRPFLILSFCYFILVFSYEHILVTDELIYYDFDEQLSYERIAEIIQLGKTWEWLSYVIVLIILILRLLFVGICFSIGAFFTNSRGDFKKHLQIAVNADFVLLMPIVFKLIWYGVFQNSYSMDELQTSSVLSLLNLFDPAEVELWLLYPLQLLNLFELTYWCILALQLQKLLNRDFIGSIGFVAVTYGLGLLLWVIFMMFLTVSLT